MTRFSALREREKHREGQKRLLEMSTPMGNHCLLMQLATDEYWLMDGVLGELAGYLLKLVVWDLHELGELVNVVLVCLSCSMVYAWQMGTRRVAY